MLLNNNNNNNNNKTNLFNTKKKLKLNILL